MDILKPEESKTQEILVPITSTPTMNRPLADADSESKGGNSGCGSAGQMEDRVGSSDGNDDEDESKDEMTKIHQQ
jgi:hypothetical protein